jgi:hypothetical protein
MPDDGLSPERVIRALARPGLGDELRGLGVRDWSTFGGADVYVPPERESYVRELIDQAFGTETLTARAVHEGELDLGGSYSPAELAAAARAYAAGRRRIKDVERAAHISYRRARRVRSWLEAGAIFWNGRTVEAGRGYQVAREPEADPPRIRLFRRYPA